MALISGGTYVVEGALGLDLCGNYNRLALISVGIKSGVYCNIQNI